MAPSNHLVVTLKAPSEELKKYDFSENKPPALKKPRKRPAKKSEAAEESVNGDEDNKPAPVANSTLNTPAAPSDPILGSLPRSLKAAPVANTAGLSLDKTPCRKWRSQIVELKTLSGYSLGVRAWTSEYTPAEWDAKVKQEMEEESVPASVTATPEPSEAPEKRKKLLPKASE